MILKAPLRAASKSGLVVSHIALTGAKGTAHTLNDQDLRVRAPSPTRRPSLDLPRTLIYVEVEESNIVSEAKEDW